MSVSMDAQPAVTVEPQARSVWRAVWRVAVEQRLPLSAAWVLTTLGLVLIAFGTPLWWFGASALTGAAICTYRALGRELALADAWLSQERTWRKRTLVPKTWLLDALYCALLTWVATIMMRDLIAGVRPISHDHTVHYFKAWQLHQDFLPRGHLHGFSHRWFAGYPVNYLYPIGTDLFVNVIDYLGLGFMSFARAYGVAFWSFHVLTGLAGYRLGRMLGGPHVGLISGFLLVTDLAAFRFGGWAYSIEYGVWPQALSLVFALFATTRVPALYHDRALRPVGAFALWMGAAIVTHPITLIYLGLLLVAAVLAGLFAPHVRTARGTARLLFAYGLSVGVSAVWLLPFTESSKHTTPMGVWWDSAFELGKGLINLTSFPGTIGYVLVFGLVACVLLLRSGQFTLLLTAFMALLVPAIANSSFIDELHLPQLSPSLGKIQWLRLAPTAKPFWFAMAGYALVAVLRKARELVPAGQHAAHTRPRTLFRDVALSMVVAQLTLPFVIPAAQTYFTSNIAKALNTETDRALDVDRAALVDWLQHNLPNDAFYRVCVSTGHNHDLLDLGTLIKQPIYKRGFTPAENFIYKMNTEDDAVLRAVNVRFMIAKKWLPPADFTSLAQFGVYQVYEYKHWQRQPFVVSQGAGAVSLQQFDAEEIRLRAAPGAHGQLRLNVSYFPRWHAYRDGKPIALWPSALAEAATSTGFMTVPLEPGDYHFVFERSALDHISQWISLLCIPLAFAFVVSGRLRGGFPRISRLLARSGELFELGSSPRFSTARRVSAGLVAVAGLALVVYFAEMPVPLTLENLDGATIKKVRYDFLEQLTSARVAIDYPARLRRCRRLVDRFACRNEDGNIDNEKYVASTPAEIEEYRMVRCIRARPEDGARLELVYSDVPTGDAIVGYFGIERAGRMMRVSRPVDFHVEVDGQEVFAGATQSDNKMHWFRAPVTGPARPATVKFSVSAANVFNRFFCFYAQMADLRDGPAAPGQSNENKAPTRRPVGEVEDEPSR
ncbi:MAG: hypothetical protein RL701_5353 [Pseudomonadota bacterium]